MRWEALLDPWAQLTIFAASRNPYHILPRYKPAPRMNLTMEPDLCASLHNEIVRRGWEGTGRSMADAPFVTFWDNTAAHHKTIASFASDSLVNFYKSALVLPHDAWEHWEPYQNFFYFISDLTWPWTDLNRGALTFLNSVDQNRYIVLYQLTNLESHYLGLVMDQKTGGAIMQPNLFSVDLDRPDLQWQPLHTILRAWLDMIDCGKVVAADFKAREKERSHDAEYLADHFREIDAQYPWRIRSWSQKVLVSTIAAYQRLVSAIESRMPLSMEQPMTVAANASVPLASSEDMDNAQLPKESFLRSFLGMAQMPRNPRLKYIAPGITLPTSSSVCRQPFRITKRQTLDGPKDLEHNGGTLSEEVSNRRPFLLFPSAEGLEAGFAGELYNEHPFQWPYNKASRVAVGLWMDTVDSGYNNNPYEDGSLLVLPVSMGTNARYSDGVRIDGNKKFELYQTYHNPFTIGHQVQLHLILDSWAAMVEKGHWSVGQDGVSGSVDVFMQADVSRSLAERYTAALHW